MGRPIVVETAPNLQVLYPERPEIRYNICPITQDKRKCFVKNVNLLLQSINLLPILLHEPYFFTTLTILRAC